MSGRTYPDFSELAYHIIRLCDFWKRSRCHPQDDSLVHVIGTMIGISVGLENADQLARAVIMERDALRSAGNGDEVDPEGLEVLFISSFLQAQVAAPAVPAMSGYFASMFD